MAEENHAAQRQTAVAAYFKIKELLLLSSNPLKLHYSPKHRVTFMKTDLVYKKSANAMISPETLLNGYSVKAMIYESPSPILHYIRLPVEDIAGHNLDPVLFQCWLTVSDAGPTITLSTGGPSLYVRI